MGDFRREVQFTPGYDHREEDRSVPDGQRRGCHGMGIRFVLHGDAGTVQFVLGTDWLPTFVHGAPEALRVKGEHSPVSDLYPTGRDFGHHWPAPTYEGEMRMECDLLEQGFCFYDGSGLYAEHVLGLLLTQGHDAVWRELEIEYERLRVEMSEANA